jgi:hypothetical protein
VSAIAADVQSAGTFRFLNWLLAELVLYIFTVGIVLILLINGYDGIFCDREAATT